jgi:hypothetical protein
MYLHKAYTPFCYNMAKGFIMCMQYQRLAKPQKKNFRTKDMKEHIPYDSSLIEHGDPDFVDMRVKKTTRKEKGFFEKFFS